MCDDTVDAYLFWGNGLLESVNFFKKHITRCLPRPKIALHFLVGGAKRYTGRCGAKAEDSLST